MSHFNQSVNGPSHAGRLQTSGDYLQIRGQKPLSGTVQISGSKNASLPMMAACLMAGGRTSLHGVPRLSDTDTMQQLLRELGCRVLRHESSAPDQQTSPDHPKLNGQLDIEVDNQLQCEASESIVGAMRASICVLGPLLAKRGRAVVSQPGGCAIGNRPIELHLKGLTKLGAEFRQQNGCLVGSVNGRLRGATVYMQGPAGPTVLGTINVMSAATLASGVTRIVGAACEPEVVDCADLLNKMGARITGAGTPQITIEGVDALCGAEHTVIPDRIEAGTFLIAVGAAGGQLRLKNARADHLVACIEALAEAGIQVHAEPSGGDMCKRNALESQTHPAKTTDTAGRTGTGDDLTCDMIVTATQRPGSLDIATWPYPGFPTDLQPQLMAMLAVGNGRSVITERIFPDRFLHVAELSKMGAKIRSSEGLATIDGAERLRGGSVNATDLRASAALIVAALAAGGTTRVHDLQYVDRGYEKIEAKLAAAGAEICRVDPRPALSVTISDNVGQSVPLRGRSKTSGAA